MAEGMAATVYLDQTGDDLKKCFSKELLNETEGADLFEINNEFCYSNGGSPLLGKDYTFRSNPERAKLLSEIGVGLAQLVDGMGEGFAHEAAAIFAKVAAGISCWYSDMGEIFRKKCFRAVGGARPGRCEPALRSAEAAWPVFCRAPGRCPQWQGRQMAWGNLWWEAGSAHHPLPALWPQIGSFCQGI